MLNLPNHAEYIALEDWFIRMLISCVCELIGTYNLNYCILQRTQYKHLILGQNNCAKNILAQISPSH